MNTSEIEQVLAEMKRARQLWNEEPGEGGLRYDLIEPVLEKIEILCEPMMDFLECAFGPDYVLVATSKGIYLYRGEISIPYCAKRHAAEDL